MLQGLLDVLLALCGCAAFHSLFPAAPGASALRCLAVLAAGNGAAALALAAASSPLPFK